MNRDEDNTPASAMDAMAMMATKDAMSTTAVPATESAKTVIGFSAVAVHHVPIGVHHTHHDVGDDGVEQRCDEQRLNHAAEGSFRDPKLAADGTNFDGA